LNHLVWLFKILRKLFAETAGLFPYEFPINKVLSNIGIFYLFDK